MGTDVTLDRYAAIRAEMEAGIPRDEALARAGLTVEAWTSAQRGWLAEMGTEIERGRFDLTNRYTQAFLERQRAVTSPEPAKPSPSDGSALASAVPALVDAPPVAPTRLPPPRPPPPKPTFLAAAESPAPPPAAPPPSPPPLGATMLETAPEQPSPLRAALPFQGAEPRVPLQPGAASTAAPRVDALAAGVASKGASPSSPAGGAPAATVPRPLPKVNRAPAALTGTTAGLVVPKAAVLPFQQSASPPAKAAPPAAAPPATGAEAKAAPTGPALTLEQYASLCVEMSLEPQRAGETLQRYGLTGEQARDVDVHWKGRIATEPGMRVAFDRAYAAYRTWRMTAHGKAPTT